MMMRPILSLFILLFVFQVASGQTSIGPEIQVYPTGIIPGLRIEKAINNKASFNFRIGYQWIRHRDLGVHEDERGNGFGFSLGYKRFFSDNTKGFSLSVRTDLWFNSLDWKDNIDTSDEISGQTDITVLQPTLVLEDAFRLSDSWMLVPSIGFGYEWNVKTDGEPTGEGAILLVGVSLMAQL